MADSTVARWKLSLLFARSIRMRRPERGGFPKEDCRLRIQWFQHVPFEGLGTIASWALRAGHELAPTRFFLGEIPPPPDSPDAVIVLGGPMGVGDGDRHPWLGVEVEWLRAFARTGKKALGICLGAQLLARALGAVVQNLSRAEIGWLPVRREAGAGVFDGLPDTFEALHWHGETFEIPRGAVHLASSAACANQAFLWKKRVLGLQFHLEMEPDGVRELVRQCPGDVQAIRDTPSLGELPGSSSQFAGSREAMMGVLDRFLG